MQRMQVLGFAHPYPTWSTISVTRRAGLHPHAARWGIAGEEVIPQCNQLLSCTAWSTPEDTQLCSVQASIGYLQTVES